MKRLRCKRGQGTIETVFAFIILVILVGAMINVWFWFNNQMVERQVHYNDTRVAAGTGRTPYSNIVTWNYVAEAPTENMIIPR
jgi:hypothetical protein